MSENVNLSSSVTLGIVKQDFISFVISFDCNKINKKKTEMKTDMSVSYFMTVLTHLKIKLESFYNVCFY